tara:strand:- start:202 stop:507 length:306 start_codon:yes stop_codon:yes gene_type:complete
MTLIIVIENAQKWFQKEYIYDIFQKCDWGEIEQIQISKNIYSEYNTIYIYYKSWKHHKSHARFARDFLVRLKKNLKLYYAPDHYWVIKATQQQPYPFYEVI